MNGTAIAAAAGAAYLQVYAAEVLIGLRNIRYEDVTEDSGIKVEVSR